MLDLNTVTAVEKTIATPARTQLSLTLVGPLSRFGDTLLRILVFFSV